MIDLLDGRAVHARGGRRSEYMPLESAAGAPIGGDPLALARVYVQRLGLQEIYIADLDAIAGRAPHEALVATIAGLGGSIWLDAGASSVADASRALASGASRVIVGLETLRSFHQLHAITSAVGSERVAFSLDLRGDLPIFAPDADIAIRSPVELAVAIVEAGVNALIVLDLERVGTGAGIEATLLATLREAVPDVLLFAGGGVCGPDDLSRLVEVGCDGALVATALQNGAIDPKALRQ